MLKTKLPPGSLGRLHIVAGEDFPFVLCCALIAADARLECALRSKSGVSALLTHDADVVSTDARGWALAHAVIEAGGTAMFAFARLAGAMA